jgi:hypothetical protein
MDARNVTAPSCAESYLLSSHATPRAATHDRGGISRRLLLKVQMECDGGWSQEDGAPQGRERRDPERKEAGTQWIGERRFGTVLVLQSLKAAASPAPNGPDCIMNVECGACPGPYTEWPGHGHNMRSFPLALVHVAGIPGRVEAAGNKVLELDGLVILTGTLCQGMKKLWSTVRP